MDINVGDLVRYRRVQVNPAAAITGGPAYDWVDDIGIVLRTGSRRHRLGDSTCDEVNPVDYLIRVYFPCRPNSPYRTLRASKVAEV